MLYNKVTYHRKMKGITQSKLAELCGISQNTISDIENFKHMPTALHAALICEALNCKFEECFFIVKKELGYTYITERK